MIAADATPVVDVAALRAERDALAAELGIGIKTVETHRANLNRKLGTRSTADLVRHAARTGQLPGVTTSGGG